MGKEFIVFWKMCMAEWYKFLPQEQEKDKFKKRNRKRNCSHPPYKSAIIIDQKKTKQNKNEINNDIQRNKRPSESRGQTSNDQNLTSTRMDDSTKITNAVIL